MDWNHFSSSGRWGTKVHGTHFREGEAGHNVLLEGDTEDTLRSPTVYTKLQRIAEQARRYPERVFTTLAHLIDVDFLREAYYRTRKNSAPGVDGETAEEYAEDLEMNLQHLHWRLRNGRYKAPPVKRTWLEKDDGSQRPIGMPAFEDKIVQRAVAMILCAIYEQDFYDFSYGFREGRSPHQALASLRESCRRLNIKWIVDADVSGFFDNIDHSKLREIIRRRVNDGMIIRLIGKWLNAGVLEDGQLIRPETGTPQGGVISPVLANIFLHAVLDEWYGKEIKPQLRGRSFLLRFADDFVIGCELEDDARRVMAVLPKRFGRFNLTIHPTKTTMIEFGKPNDRSEQPSGNSTFDFLGFTHYWTRSRRGYWVIKRKTARKRLRRTMRSLWTWCRNNRHEKITEQYRKLCLKLRGHYAYYGIRCNYRWLQQVYQFVWRTWRYWLSRRSSKSFISLEKFEKILKKLVLPQPRIVHNI